MIRFSLKSTIFGVLFIIFNCLVWRQDLNTTDYVTFEKILKSPGSDWLTYAGDYKSTRYSPLSQINRNNVSRFVEKWAYHVKNETSNLRVTPLVHGGIMYITNAYELEALDASSGKHLWSYRASQYPDHWMNRGAALLNDKVFFITKDSVLTALNARTGKLWWRTKYADEKRGYYSTVAPLAVKDKIIVGVSGGDEGIRGFVAAFAASDGRELWRFWTIPETGMLKGGAATWTTGSYDNESNLIYWATGGPWPSFEGENRPGDNLYSDCVVALDIETGNLNWHFQFMPHDLRHWDANEPLILADIDWFGKPCKVLMQANRNGFFYVLDRINGRFLMGAPFVRKMTWTSGLDAKGRPIEVPEKNVSWSGKIKGICPGLTGATNWMSSSYSQNTGLFYITVLESCDMEHGNYFLRAIDPKGGKMEWEYPMPGLGSMYAGALSTAGWLVFAGDNAGHLMALDAATGKVLWQFATGYPIFASPMTYEVEGRQYVAIAAGPKIFVFGLSSKVK